MFCSKCGAQLPEAGKFCPQCGTLIQQAISIDQPTSVQHFTNQGQKFTNQTKARLTNSKIAIMIISALSFIFIFAIPYVKVLKSSSEYSLYLTGADAFPNFLDNKYEAEFSIVLLLFIAALITIILSLLMEKKTLCMIASIANIIISFTGFSSIMNMVGDARSSYNDVYCIPLGCFLQIGIAIAIIIMVTKERKTKQ